MAHDVAFAPEAEDDLIGLYDYIAERASPEVALLYIQRIQSFCVGFTVFPSRGVQRDDVRPGLRLVGFERRVTIAFHVDIKRIIIDRVLYAGRQM